MNKERSLEEDVRHGTKERPLTAIRFSSGKGTAYPSYFFVERHWHKEIEILQILKGSYTIELNLENYHLNEGNLCIVNSGELHQMEGIEKNTVHDAVIFHPDILGCSYGDEYQETFAAPLLLQKTALPHIIDPSVPGYRELVQLCGEASRIIREGGEDWYFQAKLRLMEMMWKISRNGLMLSQAEVQNAAEKERIDRYKRVVSYIEQNYASQITLEKLAEVAQCNPQYLCHFFKGIAGVSPIQYLISYRVGQAEEMLRKTTKSVLEISFDCGFDNVSYFIRRFKKDTGKTPGIYRKTNAGRR